MIIAFRASKLPGWSASIRSSVRIGRRMIPDVLVAQCRLDRLGASPSMRSGIYREAMSVPDYDEDRARSAKDWADAPGASEVLRDVPTRCIFCDYFIAITDTDPLLVVAKPWQQTGHSWLYAAHQACLDEHADRSGTR